MRSNAGIILTLLCLPSTGVSPITMIHITRWLRLGSGSSPSRSVKFSLRFEMTYLRDNSPQWSTQCQEGGGAPGGGAAKLVKLNVKPVVDLLVDGVVLVADLLARHPLLHSHTRTLFSGYH